MQARRARRPLHELVQRALTSQPTLIAAVVHFNGVILKLSGETQIIMTVPQE